MSEDVEDLTGERAHRGVATRHCFGTGTELQFLGSCQQDNPITPAGIPHDLVGTADDADLRDFCAGDPKDDRSDRENFNLGFYVNKAVADGVTITDGPNTTREESETLNPDIRLTGAVTTGAAIQRLLFGFDLRRYTVEERTALLFSDPLRRSRL